MDVARVQLGYRREAALTLLPQGVQLHLYGGHLRPHGQGVSLMVGHAEIAISRAALGISVRQLAERSGVAESPILRFETGRRGILATNLDKVQTTLEEGGVIFISADASGGPGVRLAK